MPQFFINRPVFAWVIAILITLAGTISIFNMAVEAYPQIAPPSVNVSASYPGASAAVLESSVTNVIEQQLTGLEGLLYFTSSSSNNGRVHISLFFENGTDLDIAAVETQNRVSSAEPRLPEEVRRNGIHVGKANSGFLMLLSLQSTDGSLDREALNNLMEARVLDPIQRVSGVGGANQFGSGYAMRIWLNPDKLHGYGLTAVDALNAVRAQNVQFAAGAIGAAPAVPGQGLTVNVTAESRFSSPEQFRNIILRTNVDGSTVRLGDVARVELGSSGYGFFTRSHGKPVAGAGIELLPGANALSVSKAVRAKMAELAKTFPAGVTWSVPFDASTFVRISIVEVVKTLGEAIVLVFLVMLLFLQNLRATLIPTIVVPVALTGAFGGLYLAGFSINVLTLFGLVLAIGIVVDDAIVVVENVERIMSEEGLPPREATQKGMGQITGAIVAVTTVLASVFIPSAMMGGSVGAIYRQFALTIAISMALSAIMALSFTPALCATLIKPVHGTPNRFLRWFNRNFDRVTRHYLHRVGQAVHHTPRWMAGFVLVVLLVALLFWRLPSSFLPSEDQGYMLAVVQLPPGATIDRTSQVMASMTDILDSNPDIADVVEVGGFSFLGSGENVGMAFIQLTPWDERDKTAEQLIGWANGAVQGIKDAQIFVVNLPVIQGLGQFGGFDFRLEDRGGLGHDKLVEARNVLLAKASQNPVLMGVRPNGLEDSPQLKLTVDRLKAQTMGLSVNDVYTAIQLMLAPVYANDFDYEGRIQRVELQAQAPYRMSVDGLDHYYVRNSGGELVPVSTVVTPQWQVGPPTLDRYNGFSSVAITGSAAPGHSSGEAMSAMEHIVEAYLPDGIGYEWSGQSLQEIMSGAQAPIVYALSLIVVFLCLAALYESWSIPLSVLMVVPLGVLGTLLFTWARGLSDDIYFKIGVIAIIGLAAKNAILIIEFARAEQNSGKGAVAAVMEACRLRFRPVLMTSIAFIFGVLPLAVSTGAGANSRHAIGTGVIGGMVLATTLGVLMIPVFYVFVRRLVGDKSDGREDLIEKR
ncbi:MAG TPA: multidrug efflux RND transporter permease subunit [Rhodanobacteraceae bacterium]|nr:multidrug efflux RND transporter permease subunit [Rhodanobacteraceae bacterium]